MKKYISLAQAGARSSRGVSEWEALCEAGVIDCQQHYDTWFVGETDLGYLSIPGPEERKLLVPLVSSTLEQRRNASRGLLGVLAALVLFAGLAAGSQASVLSKSVATLRKQYQAAVVAVTQVPSISNPGLEFLNRSAILLTDRVKNNWSNFLGDSATSTPRFKISRIDF